MPAYANSGGHVFEQIKRENAKMKNLAKMNVFRNPLLLALPEAHSKVAGDAGIWSPIAFCVFLLLIGLLLKL